MALLELLARAAPAGVVAPDALLVLEVPRLDRSGKPLRLLDRPRRGARAALGRGGQRARLVGGGAAGVAEGTGGAGVARGAPLRGGLLVGAGAVAALDLHVNVEDVARELVPDVVHELGEHRETLVLVGHEGVDLGEPAEVDALAQ